MVLAAGSAQHPVITCLQPECVATHLDLYSEAVSLHEQRLIMQLTAIAPDTSVTVEAYSRTTERLDAQVQSRSPKHAHAGVLTGQKYNMGCPCFVMRAALWPLCNDSSNQTTEGRL